MSFLPRYARQHAEIEPMKSYYVDGLPDGWSDDLPGRAGLLARLLRRWHRNRRRHTMGYWLLLSQQCRRLD